MTNNICKYCEKKNNILHVDNECICNDCFGLSEEELLKKQEILIAKKHAIDHIKTDTVSFLHKNGTMQYGGCDQSNNILYKVYSKDICLNKIICQMIGFKSTNEWTKYLCEISPPFDIHPRLKRKLYSLCDNTNNTKNIILSSKERIDVLKACKLGLSYNPSSIALLEFNNLDINYIYTTVSENNECIYDEYIFAPLINVNLNNTT